MEYCLPRYHFFVLDDTGWNFRYGKFHQENRRTLTKAYGLKFILKVNGRGGKFDLTNTVIIVGNCFGLIGIINFVYDFIVINFPSEMRTKLLEKKYDRVEESDTKILLKHSMAAISSIGILPQQYEAEQEIVENSNALENVRSLMAMTSVRVLPEEYEEWKNERKCATLEQIARAERLI